MLMSTKLPGIPESEGSTRPLKKHFFATFAKTQVEKNSSNLKIKGFLVPYTPLPKKWQASLPDLEEETLDTIKELNIYLMRDLIYPFCPNKMNFNVKKKMDQIKVFGWPYLLRNW